MIEYIDGEAYKWCPRCEDYIPVEDFLKHKGMLDGLASYCKPCWRAYRRKYMHEYYQKNREYINQNVREYRQTNPEKYHQYLFRGWLNNAVRAGKIIKSNSCSICGSSEQIEAHHPDYEPGHELVVVWVCRQCHINIHMELKNGTI